jgi:hypothetical protein
MYEFFINYQFLNWERTCEAYSYAIIKTFIILWNSEEQLAAVVVAKKLQNLLSDLIQYSLLCYQR